MKNKSNRSYIEAVKESALLTVKQKFDSDMAGSCGYINIHPYVDLISFLYHAEPEDIIPEMNKFVSKYEKVLAKHEDRYAAVDEDENMLAIWTSNFFDYLDYGSEATK